MTEVVNIAETSANFYGPTWRNFLEDSGLHIRRR